MRTFTRQCSSLRALRPALRDSTPSHLQSRATALAPSQLSQTRPCPSRALLSNISNTSSYREIHTSRQLGAAQAPKDDSGMGPTDFNELNVLGNTPAPATSVDVCMYDGFGLNSGVTISGGNGALLVSGESFEWRPWEAKGKMELVNGKGQFDIPAEALGVFDMLWPRPDLLVIGVGKQNLPLSPQTRQNISKLGMRVEVLDTRNAAAQFNLLATERGVEDVAAALIPIGWKEGVGAA